LPGPRGPHDTGGASNPEAPTASKALQGCCITALRRLREYAREIGAEVIPFEDEFETCDE
jgi:hypothetical protein